jgi:hypothetical protein
MHAAPTEDPMGLSGPADPRPSVYGPAQTPAHGTARRSSLRGPFAYGLRLDLIAGGLFAGALLFSGCALLQGLKDRLGVLGMKFSMERVDVSRLVYPNSILSAAAGAFFPDRSLLGQFGVDVVCGIRAANRNPARAVFDGAVGRLRVQDLSLSAPSAQGSIPAFAVGPDSETVINVTFPLRLDNPVFAKAAWKAMVAGKDVPYRVDAELSFRLPGASSLGLPDSVRTVTLNVDKGSVNSKATGGTLVDRFLALLDRVL